MPSPMIERAARDLKEEFEHQGSVAIDDGDFFVLDGRVDCAACVRAVLLAIRTPDDGMDVAGMEAFSKPEILNWDKLSATYTAMIDHILGESGDG